MTFQKTIVLIIVSLLGLSLGLSLLRTGNKRPLTHRPAPTIPAKATIESTPLSTQRWDETHAEPNPAVPLDVAFLNNIQITTSTRKINVSIDNIPSAPPNAYDYQIHRMKPDQPLEFDGIRLSLDRIEISNHGKIRKASYTPTLDLISMTTSTRSSSNHPDDNQLSLYFDAEMTSNSGLRPMSIVFFDAQTHQTASGGSHSSSHSNRYERTRFSLGANFKLRPGAPIEAVVELISGPIQTDSCSAAVSGAITTGPLTLVYLAYAPHGTFGFSSTAKLVSASSANGEPNSHTQSLLFFAWPSVSIAGFECVAFDKNGQEINGSGTFSNQHLCGYQFDNSTPIDSFDIRRYSHHHRIFIEIPALPGVPWAK